MLAFGIRIHQWLSSGKATGMHITHPRGIYSCFVFDIHFEIYQISKRQNQSVVNAFSYMSVALPCKLRGRNRESDRAKIRNFSEE